MYMFKVLVHKKSGKYGRIHPEFNSVVPSDIPELLSIHTTMENLTDAIWPTENVNQYMLVDAELKIFINETDYGK